MKNPPPPPVSVFDLHGLPAIAEQIEALLFRLEHRIYTHIAHPDEFHPIDDPIAHALEATLRVVEEIVATGPSKDRCRALRVALAGIMPNLLVSRCALSIAEIVINRIGYERCSTKNPTATFVATTPTDNPPQA